MTVGSQDPYFSVKASPPVQHRASQTLHTSDYMQAPRFSLPLASSQGTSETFREVGTCNSNIRFRAQA